jgi:phage head maturation protease
MVDYNMLIVGGGALKALGEGRVGGYAVYFTSEHQFDLDGDFFTKQTNFELEDRTALSLYFAHGGDPTMKKRELGKAAFKVDDVGVWAETQLDLRDKWLEKIYELVKKGVLSYSSGAISHLVERVRKANATWVKTWPIGEVSFTPCP